MRVPYVLAGIEMQVLTRDLLAPVSRSAELVYFQKEKSDCFFATISLVKKMGSLNDDTMMEIPLMLQGRTQKADFIKMS